MRIKNVLGSTLVIMLCVLFSIGYAEDKNDFKSYKQKMDSEFEQYEDKQEKEFKEYRKKLEKAFQEYKESVSKVWGKKHVAVPSRKDWVQYRDNMRERNIVNFKNGTAKVQVKMTEQKAKNSEKCQKELRQAVVNTIAASADTRSIIDIAKKPSTPRENSHPAVLKGQIKNKQGEKVTSENAKDFAKQVVKDKKVQKIEQKKDEGEKGVIASVEFKLVPDHLKKRAKRYMPIVTEHAKKRDFEVQLILALIETESYFNPTARSPIPAFGLMQLVPTTGGRDAYQFVYGKDKAPTDEFLYQPEKNVRLGVAYMHIVYTRYLKEIKNEKSRLWCTIAAYNTGAGNVLRTFAPGKEEALQKINSMDPEEVYSYLRRELPYKETRKYVKKVRNKMAHYSSI